MKRNSFGLALATVALANAFALVHVWLNRAGTPEALITIRDAQGNSFAGRESSLDVFLPWHVRNSDLNNQASSGANPPGPAWLSVATLRSLGFDCSLSLTDSRAERFYRSQPPRRAFVAAEIQNEVAGTPLPRSALVVFDAGLDADALRGRYPDASKTVILPAVLSLRLITAHLRGIERPGHGANMPSPEVTADVSGMPSQIHIPKPFSDEIRARKFSPYVLHLKYGRFHEPWVAGVDFPATH